MASLRKKDRSPFWFACFTLSDGTRTQRSTGATDRRQAQRIANEFEDAARAAAGGRFIESRARKTIADIYAMANVNALPSSTIGDFLNSWLKRKELEAGEQTHLKYTGVVEQFKSSLGNKAKREITSIVAADIALFRDELSRRVATSTTNTALKIIRSAFAQARRDGLIDVNEAERVTLLKRKVGSFERRPFTLEELKRILDVANDEWRGMILFGLYTGQRLGDVARLTWANLDLQQHELHLVTSKTGRRQIIPLATPLFRYLLGLPSSDNPDAPLFAHCSSSAQSHTTIGTLSNQFYGVLVAAGLAPQKSHKAIKGDDGKSKGRSVKREQNPLSFHCLRHTATSLLKNAGVSESVAMEFVGHDSTSISRNYTHIDTATLKNAASKLPDITNDNK
jgi:integrase